MAAMPSPGRRRFKARVILLAPLVLLVMNGCRSAAQGLGGLGDDLGSVGSFEDGIGPGEDFGDYEDKYTADDGEGAGEDEEERQPIKVGDVPPEGSPAAHMDGIVDLDDITFERVLQGVVVKGGSKMLVVLYAPWDRACQEAVPVMKALGEKFAWDTGTLVAKADVDRFEGLAQRFDISTYTESRSYKYPHFMLFKPGDSVGLRFVGKPTIGALVDFALDMNTVGLVEELRPLVKEFMAASRSSATCRDGIIARVDALLPSLTAAKQEWAGYYKKVMSSILEKGDSYPSKESERLSGIIKESNLQMDKLVGFRRRLNVLKVFLKPAPHDEL